MDQYYQTPDNYQPEEPTNPKGKFSFVWGIAGCAVSIILYIVSMLALIGGVAFGLSMTIWIVLTLVSIIFLILSICTLIAGINGIRISPRTKAIVGTALSVQNLIAYIIITSICICGMVTSSHFHHSYYDYDDLYEAVDELPDYDDIFDY